MSVNDDGTTTPLGQSNCHMIFNDTYVELTSVHGNLENHHLRDAIARYYGFHIVVLRTPDAHTSQAGLASQSMAVAPVVTAAREVNYPNNKGTAGFDWFRVPESDLPEAFVCYMEHKTKELCFDSALANHANGASDLVGITLCSADAPLAARRFAAATGGRIDQDGTAQMVSLPAGGIVRCVDPAGLDERFPGINVAPLPWAAAFTLKSHDLALSRAWFESKGIKVAGDKDRFWLMPDQAEGAAIEFVGG